MSKQTSTVLTINDWNTSAIRYMQPKVDERGAKSINVISTQTNRALSIQAPLMMTWGIADFTDPATGLSDGKFTISLVFPNDQYKKQSTDDFFKKLTEFENQVIDDAVRNSEAWFGSELSRDVVKHMYFSQFKYTKDKVTKKFDTSKPPTIRAKVPNYEGRWGVELYDTSSRLIFPDAANENITPMDLVPKKSHVVCELRCGGIWIGGKGFGLTFKLVQAVVKPLESVSQQGRCHLQLPEDELMAMSSAEIPSSSEETSSSEKAMPVPVQKVVQSTEVEDSDEEAEVEVEEEEVVAEVVAPVAVKKVVKKAVPTPVATEEVAVAVEVVEEAKPAVKKVVKRKV